MALYTKLNKKQIQKIVSYYGLGPPRSIKGILQGTVNTYYRLTYPQQIYFLKIDEVGDLTRLNKELQILRLLQSKKTSLQFETPVPLKTLTHKEFLFFRKKYVLLFKKIDGRSYYSDSLSNQRLLNIGKALAMIHRCTKNCLLLTHRFNISEQIRVYKSVQNKLQKKHPAVALDIQQWIIWLKKNEPCKMPSGLIHADLFPENIHFKGNRIVGILDFEAAGKGAFLFDIAVTIHACCHNGKKFNLHQIKSFLKGYQQIRKLNSREKNFFEYYLYESCLRFLLTRLRDFELKSGPVKAKPFKDYTEYFRRFSEIPSLIKRLNRELFNKTLPENYNIL